MAQAFQTVTENTAKNETPASAPVVTKVTQIITGEALWDENKKISDGKQGDQLQDSIPDYKGEVRLIKYTPDSFIDLFDSTKNSRYRVYRLIDAQEAAATAELMIRACNNPNIGYDQNRRGGIKSHGVDSAVSTSCDCSSLASYCMNMACGGKTGVDGTSVSMGGQLDKSGKCYPSFSATLLSNPDNLPYNGDIFVRPKNETYGGHVFVVVSGHPREGLPDEVVSDSLIQMSDYVPGVSYSSSQAISVNVSLYQDQYGNTFEFIPREVEPDPYEAAYPLYYNQSYGTTANGSYAWGRFSEVMKCECNLFRGDPRKWYLYKEDGYKREMAPCVGAVMCFTNIYSPTDPGIVCVVEKIENNKITVSQRNPQTGQFELLDKQKREGSWDMDLDNDGKYEYVFQGFIYNPTVDIGAHSDSAQDKFIELAKAQIGTSGKYTEQKTGYLTANSAWSAAFIVAVAKECGSVLNVIVPNTYSCSDIGRIGVIRNMGIWLEGPNNGKFPEPKPGDIALFRTATFPARANRYASDKAGIIVEVGGTSGVAQGTNQGVEFTFKVVMGDCSGKVKQRTYTTSSKSFSGIFRPNWAQVDGTTESVRQFSQIEGMYTEGTSLEDASIRDLRYVNLTDKGFEPSIKSTDITLCAINYTGMLANLYSAFAEVGSSSATDADLVVDLWNNTVKSTFQDDSYPMVTFAGTCVKTEMSPGVMSLASMTLEAGGSATVTTTAQIPQTDIDSLESSSAVENVEVTVGDKIDANASFYEESITKTIVITNVVKVIYDTLNSELNNPAGVIGIMANMFHESEFNCSSQDSETKGCGLIHWTNSKTNTAYSNRCNNMKKFCEQYGEKTSWKDNLEGQLRFLIHEANTNSQFKIGMNYIKKTSKDISGSLRATRLFLDYFILEGVQHMGEIKEVEQYNLRSGWTRALWTLFFGGKQVK